ncbi:cytochrome P450 4B1-like isoform X3 [Mercenaria mercenaria]|uniref:cytochrome P450 4B1-like isoform X3 n=1 Tax=Mercenaria mercenaria TaxID=6596 RepID=UPI00234EE6D0|nr:cytochrome P450 4B1-like isoform X3 [Mercenaria mercenaria]
MWKVYKITTKWLQLRKLVEGIPVHPDNHWLLGLFHKAHTLDEVKHLLLEFMDKASPKWFVAWLLFIKPGIFPASPDILRQVLSATNVPKRHGLAGPYRMFSAWAGDGLLVSNGKKWERNRRLLTPAFHFDILKPYVSVFNHVVGIFMEKVDEMSEGGLSIDVYPMLSRATLDTMLRCVMSYNDDTVQNTGSQHPYVAATHRLGQLLMNRVINPFIYFDFIYYNTSDGKEFKRLCNEVHEFSTKIIEKRKRTIEAEKSKIGKRHLDFLDILITAKDENGEGLTFREIRDEVDTFMFAGHDTTASVINWVLWSLAKYPEMQDKVRKEVEDILDEKEEPNSEDLGKFQYMLCFIKEVMRWYTPVPAGSRTVESPFTIDGITFPPGQIIDLHYYLVHHNPTVWDNHWEFSPERFLPENSVHRDPYAFIPFSAGQRNCIGQNFAMNEIKTFIARVVKRYTLRVDPDKEAVPIAEIVTRAKDGVYIHFDQR